MCSAGTYVLNERRKKAHRFDDEEENSSQKVNRLSVLGKPIYLRDKRKDRSHDEGGFTFVRQQVERETECLQKTNFLIRIHNMKPILFLVKQADETK